MVDSQELACTESFLFPWHFPAPCSRTFRDFEEAFVQPAKFQKIGQRWLHDPRGPTLPSLKDELMSASILKASLLCNSAPMQQCSHVNSISPWPPKCCSLLDLPTFRMELVKSSTITLLLYATYLLTFLIFRHVSHSHQPRNRLFCRPPTPAELQRRVQSKNCAPSVSLACSAAPKLSTVVFAVLVHSPLPVLKRRALSFPWSVVFFVHYIHLTIFVETESILRVSRQCCYHTC
jgi:hypothetical protein